MISEEIKKQLVEAMKKHDELKVSTMRLMVSAFNYEKIEKQHELTDDEELAVIKRAAKERRDSIDAYEKGGRADLADREKAELAILSEFLPPEITDEEIASEVDKAIASLGTAGAGDFGKVMKQIMMALSGRADGAKVAAVVKQKLAA